MEFEVRTTLLLWMKKTELDVRSGIYNSCSKCCPSASIHACICRYNDCRTRSMIPGISVILAEASKILPMRFFRTGLAFHRRKSWNILKCKTLGHYTGNLGDQEMKLPRPIQSKNCLPAIVEYTESPSCWNHVPLRLAKGTFSNNSGNTSLKDVH